MVIYPAIDVLGGRCVRLSQGDYDAQTVYFEDPLDAARAFVDAGAEWLHLVDLDGAKTGEPVTRPLLERIRQATGLRIQTGGGIRTLAAARESLEAGAERVIFGTAIARSEDLAREVFGSLGKSAVAGIDMREGKAATDGWTEGAADGLDLARKFKEMGCRHFIVTDIATDGMLSGPNLELMREFVREIGAGVIASGGVSSHQDLEHLESTGVEGVVVGKAIYEGRLDLRKVFVPL
jgi:phosphoribosylformimino-5-aminoimidazole carboxamide ribotide isomerase